MQHVKKFKILILSVSSFLGQNILDALTSRQNQIEIIGMSSEPQNAQNFRCDTFYLSPTLKQESAFIKCFLNILETEQPDLILPGRDDDVVFLAEFKQENPEYASAIHCGPPELTHIVRDKYSAWKWAQRHQLPFAASFIYQDKQDQKELEAFIKQVGFPLIAKPRQGFGSYGVFLANSWDHIHNLCEMPDLLFQEYLTPPDDFAQFLETYNLAIPLFFEIPENKHYTAQTLIRPDGSLSDVFCSVSKMKMGRDEWYQRIDEPKMLELLKKYAQILYQQGWVGPLNLQCKPDSNGDWKAYELNLRFSGGTSCRLLLGHDELGLFINAFYPETQIKDLSANPPPKAIVQRTLKDQVIYQQDWQVIKDQTYWKKNLKCVY